MSANRTRSLLILIGVVVVLSGALAVSALTYAQDDEPRITLDLKDARLEDALRLIFRPPYSFTLEPGVTGTVTVSLHDVTFSQALRAILDMNQLTYRIESNNVYAISRRQAAQPEPTPPVAVETPAAEQPVFWIGPGGRYELQALDSRYIAQWFGGYSISVSPIPYQVDAPGGGTGGGGMGGGLGGLGGGGGGMGGGLGGIGGGGGGIGGGGGGIGGGGGGMGGGGGGMGGGGGGTGGGGMGGGGGGTGGGGGSRGGGGGGGGGGFGR